MNKKILITLVILTAFLLVSCSPPEDIFVDIDHPVMLKVGDYFKIKVTVENIANHPQMLEGIYIQDDLIEGIYITKVQPRTKEMYVSPWEQALTFEGVFIPAASKQEVVITAHALKAGDFKGHFDVCIEKTSSCILGDIRIVVAN